MTNSKWYWAAFVVLCGIGIAACDDVPIDSGGDTSSSGSGSSGGSMTLPEEGGVGDACAPNDGPALEFTIGVKVVCDAVPHGPQFRFYAYPGSTNSFAVGQMWSFDSMAAEQMGAGWFYPDGIGGNSDIARSGSIKVLSVGMGTVEIHYTFVTSMGVSYAGDATITVCPSDVLCG
jgi:hypothetical protein